jgi:hypothetical protein
MSAEGVDNRAASEDDEAVTVLRRIWFGCERGFAPISWLAYTAIGILSGVVFLVDGQWVLGGVGAIVASLSLYKAIQRFRESPP